MDRQAANCRQGLVAIADRQAAKYKKRSIGGQAGSFKKSISKFYKQVFTCLKVGILR